MDMHVYVYVCVDMCEYIYVCMHVTNDCLSFCYEVYTLTTVLNRKIDEINALKNLLQHV